MSEDGNLIMVNQERKMNLSPSTIESGSDVTVSWSMPKDEASSKDWIGGCKKENGSHTVMLRISARALIKFLNF